MSDASITAEEQAKAIAGALGGDDAALRTQATEAVAQMAMSQDDKDRQLLRDVLSAYFSVQIQGRHFINRRFDMWAQDDAAYRQQILGLGGDANERLGIQPYPPSQRTTIVTPPEVKKDDQPASNVEPAPAKSKAGWLPKLATGAAIALGGGAAGTAATLLMSEGTTEIHQPSDIEIGIEPGGVLGVEFE